MNHSLKALIGLVTTGTAVAGAFLANNLLNKGQEKKEEPAPVKIDWGKRNQSRVSALAKLLKSAEEDARREMINIVSGEERERNPVFDINNEGKFILEGDVATAIHAWCSGDRVGEKEKLERRQELKKTEICNL